MRMRRHRRRGTEPAASAPPWLVLAPHGSRRTVLVFAAPPLAARLEAEVRSAGLVPLVVDGEDAAAVALADEAPRLAYVVIATESDTALRFRKRVAAEHPEVRCITLLV